MRESAHPETGKSLQQTQAPESRPARSRHIRTKRRHPVAEKCEKKACQNFGGDMVERKRETDERYIYLYYQCPYCHRRAIETQEKNPIPYGWPFMGPYV